MNNDPLRYYAALNAVYDTDEQTLKMNYREKAKIWHPDHNQEENALEQFQKISIAYDVLKDKHSRMVYDLLALAYDAANFPDMKALKIYKAVNGQETPFLRVFKLQKIKKGGLQEENLVGTFADALRFIQTTTRENWLRFWLSPRLLLKAFKSNLQQVGQNRADNFKLLVHNAAAYYNDDKNDKAWLSAVQALEYAAAAQKPLIKRFIELLPQVNAVVPSWNYQQLKNVQLKIPFIISGIVGLVLLIGVLPLFGRIMPKKEEAHIAYYQEVRFAGGGETVDDVVVAKVFNIPVDTADDNMLYHTTEKVDVMHGPSDEFDVLAAAVRRQTVRVTGYTPDNRWYRVMLDNGEMGFIKKQKLKKGIGLEIPAGSKIFNN